MVGLVFLSCMYTVGHRADIFSSFTCNHNFRRKIRIFRVGGVLDRENLILKLPAVRDQLLVFNADVTL